LNILLSLVVVAVVLTEVVAVAQAVIEQTFLVQRLVVTQVQRVLYRWLQELTQSLLVAVALVEHLQKALMVLTRFLIQQHLLVAVAAVGRMLTCRELEALVVAQPTST
jgi:hypothetical protein